MPSAFICRGHFLFSNPRCCRTPSFITRLDQATLRNSESIHFILGVIFLVLAFKHSALESIQSLKRELKLKKIIIIAGPNGAGKTTFARDFLPAEAQTLRFINADLIAAGLAPFNPESASFKAGRLMLLEIDDFVHAGHSFTFETTLSGLSYLKKITTWQHLGYEVKLWFLSLPNDDVAVSRVALRVLQGGHNIPEDIIRRRFKAGLENFHERYSKVVDSWALFDNYGIEPKLIDWSTNES